MSEEVVILIFRKILVPFIILFCFYHVYRNKKATLNIMFFYVFSLFLIFSNTFSYRHKIYYDILDKFLILVIYPIGFLILSLSFFKAKNEDVDKARKKYIGILAFFLIVEVLYIFNIF